MVAGTAGYADFISSFIESSQNLDFHKVCKDFVAFLPSQPATILDVGSGVGQNSIALAELGFSVIAVEPMNEFTSVAKKTFKGQLVKWFSDSLPDLASLHSENERFDFVLIEGVWHHLDKVERATAAMRLSELIKPKGKCAISLRNGPAGMGSRVFPTDSEETLEQFSRRGFECIFHLKNQPSILPNKKSVTWSRVVLQKR